MVRSGGIQVTLYKSDFRFSPASFSGEKSTTSNIDGYRTAIADKSGNDSFNISKDENLNRLLDTFIGTNIQRCRGIPSWNLSLVIYQLTKLLFEHLSKASVKHLTFNWSLPLDYGVGMLFECQRKTSCIYYRQDRSRSVHSLGVTLYFLPVLTVWHHSIFFVVWSYEEP